MNTLKLYNKRKIRTRIKLRKLADGKLRLTVFRSNKHIYAQIIDDNKGYTLVSASTNCKEFKDKKLSTCDTSAAKYVGMMVANAAKNVNIDTVVFDKGAYKYHGKVKALAESAREGGLKF